MKMQLELAKIRSKLVPISQSLASKQNSSKKTRKADQKLTWNQFETVPNPIESKPIREAKYQTNKNPKEDLSHSIEIQ